MKEKADEEKEFVCPTCGGKMEIEDVLNHGECYDCAFDTGNFEEEDIFDTDEDFENEDVPPYGSYVRKKHFGF